jgi:hypothetical protein
VGGFHGWVSLSSFFLLTALIGVHSWSADPQTSCEKGSGRFEIEDEASQSAREAPRVGSWTLAAEARGFRDDESGTCVTLTSSWLDSRASRRRSASFASAVPT